MLRSTCFEIMHSKYLSYRCDLAMTYKAKMSHYLNKVESPARNISDNECKQPCDGFLDKIKLSAKMLF